MSTIIVSPENVPALEPIHEDPMEQLDMSDIYPKVVETILDSDYRDDKLGLATLSILTLQARVNQLSLFAREIKGKRVTEKRREVITEHLSSIVFYATILLWICDLDPDKFTFDEILAFSEEFDNDYQTDTILCLNLATLSAAQLMELIFDDTDFADAVDDVAAGGSGEGETTDDGDTFEDIGPAGSALDSSEISQYIANILATTMIVAEQMDDTDYDIVLYNASVMEPKDI